MKYYKGFDKNMQCNGFQYEEGKTYHEEKAKLCERGFHACYEPIEVLKHYAPGEGSIYREVELDEISEERDDDSKVCAKTIKIGAKIGIPGLVHAQIEYVKAHTTTEYTDPKMATAGNRGAATAGEYGAAVAGEYGAATAGECGAATAGNCGAATAGNCGAATAGNRGAATAGECGAAVAGEYGAATAGNRGAATAGNRGAATSRGKSKTGVDGVCVARGHGAMVCGGLGSVLVIVEENKSDWGIRWWKAVVVDGETVKADTWYRLEDGDLVEVKA